ncbi:oxidoreductase [Goodfellowiella coeruleoviolacea]|uniref:Protochlorophyllide reductase n=1 Tax=Goodfellowiella coeruleoviolacea TaxID=334858 RepID=A0AAE3GBI5_9PSEU|nr:oxidoreductase [Goodfellowiella coeruleoviolacea]MCP2165257.1 protochlorophyllide reductase [Goodfellowiella coeruleoviolacea]
MTKWTEAALPDQSGRTVLITGANSGLGLRSAMVLASKGARVLLACRSAERGRRAVERVGAGGGRAEFVQLDLADLASVRSAAAEVRDRTGDALDVLINNAGVMAPPLGRTKDGFETQFGVNHLGHAALTWLLMPALRNSATGAARVVAVSSQAHRFGRLDLADPNFETRRYRGWQAYGQSKLANLLFTRELDRRARAAGLSLVSVAAHPGFAASELAPSMGRNHRSGLLEQASRVISSLVAQPVRQGALPQLYAATAPGVRGGEYYGPDGFGEVRGYPKRVAMSSAATDDHAAARLWELTADLTGVTPDPA